MRELTSPRPWVDVTPQLLMALGLLGVSGASVGLCAGMLSLRDAMTFVTRNVHDVARAGIAVLNPWTSQ